MLLRVLRRKPTPTPTPSNAPPIAADAADAPPAAAVAANGARDDAATSGAEAADADAHAAVIAMSATCPICLDDMSEAMGQATIAPCGHATCAACWEMYVATEITSGRIGLRCPIPDCRTPVDASCVRAARARAWPRACGVDRAG